MRNQGTSPQLTEHTAAAARSRAADGRQCLSGLFPGARHPVYPVVMFAA